MSITPIIVSDTPVLSQLGNYSYRAISTSLAKAIAQRKICISRIAQEGILELLGVELLNDDKDIDTKDVKYQLIYTGNSSYPWALLERIS